MTTKAFTRAFARPFIHGQDTAPDTIDPAGYSIAFGAASYTLGSDADEVDLEVADCDVGDTYALRITSSGGAGAVTGEGTIAADPHAIEGMDLSTLPAGTLTASLILTDPFGNAGDAATDTATLNPAA